MWVRATAASMKARRTGAVLLHLYAASYGRWLLSKAHPPPSPFRATKLLLGFGLFFLSRLELLPGDWWRTSCRLSEAGSFQRTLRAVGSLPPLSLPTGCRGNARTRPGFWFALPRARNRATVRTRTFSAARKSVAFPYYLLTSTFSGFAPGLLAGAFRRHSLMCPANGSSPLLARPASVTEPADVDVREATSQAQKLAEIAKLVDDFLIFQPTGCLGQCATLF